MGIIWSKFRRKESTKDILENIQNEIISLEESQKNEQSRKRIVGYVIVMTLLVSLVSGILYFFYYPPPTWSEKFLYVSQFAAVPLIIIIIKSLLTWFFTWRLRSNDRKLKSLKEKKKKILEQVMETETYKAAKEILEIYAPETLRTNVPFIATPAQTPKVPVSAGSDIRRRLTTPAVSRNMAIAPNVSSMTPVPSGYRPQNLPATTPRNHPSLPSLNTPQSELKSLPSQSLVAERSMGPAGPPMPRPVLPRERSYIDRFIEYIVGDGPTNRYALICRQCESHNGMALKDEFEYLAFRCAYCHYWNPSRKQKPPAPQLKTIQPSTPLRLALQKERKVCSSDEESEGVSDVEKVALSDEGEHSDSDFELPKVTDDLVVPELSDDPKDDILTPADTEGCDEKTLDETDQKSSELTEIPSNNEPKSESTKEEETKT